MKAIEPTKFIILSSHTTGVPYFKSLTNTIHGLRNAIEPWSTRTCADQWEYDKLPFAGWGWCDFHSAEVKKRSSPLGSPCSPASADSGDSATESPRLW
jgi:hypothetical protein